MSETLNSIFKISGSGGYGLLFSRGILLILIEFSVTVIIAPLIKASCIFGKIFVINFANSGALSLSCLTRITEGEDAFSVAKIV